MSSTSRLAGAALACADCSAGEPSWAVLNRGLLVCQECAGVHRSLGRHLSQLRSLQKSAWNAEQLALVHALHGNGANNIWEHGLLTAAAHQRVGKPSPTDPVYPTKADFIRAKYANLTFALRPPKDEGPLNQADLNRQLWSCVRTDRVETTLRLLALGADPNYADPERGTAPLHVAAKENQPLQVELLALYGADPGQPDSAGLTPAEVAVTEKHSELALRLRQLEYEASDRLSIYLCGKRPEHRLSTRGTDFLIPELAAGGRSEEVAEPRSRLRGLTAEALEKLVGDVYDEVDRRETDVAWHAALGPAQAQLQHERYLVPFLPVNPDFTATRNQSRQKLAKFSPREFAALLINILGEVRRRAGADHQVPDKASSTELLSRHDSPQRRVVHSDSSLPPRSATEDEGEDYDEVADYATPSPKGRRSKTPKEAPPAKPTTNGHGPPPPQAAEESGVKLEELMDLREALASSEAKVEALSSSHETVLSQLAQLSSTVTRLVDENIALKRQLQAAVMEPVPRLNGGASPQSRESAGLSRASATPNSPSRAAQDRDLIACQEEAIWQRREEMTAAVSSVNSRRSSPTPPAPRPRPPAVTTAAFPSMARPERPERSTPLPSGEQWAGEQQHSPRYPANLVAATEKLTRQIQTLLVDAQAGRADNYARHAGSIQTTVDGLVKLVPVSARGGRAELEMALNLIVDHCISLTVQCAKEPSPGTQRQEQLSCQVVQAAYDVAKAAKTLMSLIQLPDEP